MKEKVERILKEKVERILKEKVESERWTWKVRPRKLKVKDKRPRLLKLARLVRAILVVAMGCYPYGSTPLVMRRWFFGVCGWPHVLSFAEHV